MKKIILTVFTIFSLTSAKSQQWNGSSTSSNSIDRDGFINIFQNYTARTSLGAAWGGLNDLYGTGYIGFNIGKDDNYSYNSPWTFQQEDYGSLIYGGVWGDLFFVCKKSTGNTSGHLTNNDIRNATKVRIDASGRMLIGPNVVNSTYGNVPTGFNLIVEKGILTERLKVVSSGNNWADYVFNKTYKLKSIKEVEKFIKENKHLPGVPSAEEVGKEGIDVAQMNATLLQKIEELTLYIIQQQKDIAKQQHDITELKKALKN